MRLHFPYQKKKLDRGKKKCTFEMKIKTRKQDAMKNVFGSLLFKSHAIATHICSSRQLKRALLTALALPSIHFIQSNVYFSSERCVQIHSSFDIVSDPFKSNSSLFCWHFYATLLKKIQLHFLEWNPSNRHVFGVQRKRKVESWNIYRVKREIEKKLFPKQRSFCRHEMQHFYYLKRRK